MAQVGEVLPNKGRSGGGRRARSLVLLAACGVLVLGFALVGLHFSARMKRLENHYDRTAARMADQARSRWQDMVKRAETRDASEDFRIPKWMKCSAPGDHVQTKLSDTRTKLLVQGPGGCFELAVGELLAGPTSALTVSSARARLFTQVYLTDHEGKVLSAAEDSAELQLDTLKRPASSSSDHPRVRLGSVTYRPFWRPVLTTQNGPGAPQLFVCGLVKDRSLFLDSLRVESSHLLLGLLALVMAILCIPAAKLWLIGPHVRYGRSDVRVFKVALGAGAAISLVLLLALVAQQSLRQRLDRDLGSVAEQLQRGMRSKLTRAAQALQWFEKETEAPSTKCLQQSPPPGLEHMNDTLWKSFSRLDESGKQIQKLLRPGLPPRPCVNVSDRQYYEDISRERVTNLVFDPEAPPVHGSAEVVRSRTTGDTVLVVSIPSLSSGRTSSLEVELAGPVLKPLLPLGMQMAVIGPRGRVMLHSDMVTFHGQNIYDDLAPSGHEELRTALAADYAGPLDIEYLSAPSRAYLAPLQAGWTVVVVAPTELTDLPLRHMVLWTLLFCGMATLCSPVAYLAWLALRKRAAASESPAPQAGGHTQASVRLTLMGLVSAALATSGVLSAALPAMLRGASLRRRGAAAPPWLLPCLVVAVAIIVSFEAAYDCINEQRIKATQHHAARLLSRRRDCIDLKDCGFVGQRWEQTPSDRAAGEPDIQPTPASIVARLGLLSANPLLFPFAPDTHGSLAWRWERGEDATLRLRYRDKLFLSDGRPRLWSGLDASLIWLLPCFALAAIAIAASLRRLSFAAAAPKKSEALEAKALRARAERESRLLVLHPPRGLADALRALGLPELGEAATRADLAFVREAADYLTSPSASAELDRLLKAHEGPLIVLSAVDWIRWATPEERTQLDAMFQHFTIIRGSGVGSWPAEEAAQRALASKIWQHSSQDERDILARLALDGYAAPHRDNVPLIKHLRARGLLRAGELTFTQPELRTFVQHTVSAATLRAAYDDVEKDAWNAIRVPLSTALVLLLSLLSLMQTELTAIGLPASTVLALRPLLRLLKLGPADSPSES